MLFKFYSKAVIGPSVFVLLANIIYAIAYARLSNYKSEWETADSNAKYMLIFGVFNSVVIGILSLPIFLNTYPSINSNPLLRLLSWFLLPATWHMFIFWVSSQDYSASEDLIENPFILAAINTWPYILGLWFTYKQFHKQISKAV
ncbi:hypothetical protein [Mucilaginibacter pedocola]|uniref:Uncharacterized protein n=1 Tax=Mucilaginibacter pedocola TaxID=1792845 RepID=A0A1S9PGX7_9SPHI|nr:hypothetical protein [Mucilaginibacter pedocola]OOQ60212.1 hypothetical protein BC343_25995 [Mucilaginibacter pedocola]